MTVAALAAALVTGTDAVDLTAWQVWLGERLDPLWRVGEWDGQRQLFTGDVDHPRTAVWRCVTRACANAVTGRVGICRTCEEALAGSGLGREEFAATFVPQLQRRPGFVPEPCALVRGGVRCGREGIQAGLCKRHHGMFQHWCSSHPDRDRARWMAVAGAHPLPAEPPCAVTGCPRQQEHTNGLCALHRIRWQTHCRDRRPQPALDVWIATQTPYLGMNQFSLAPAGQVLRAELLYGLQQRDERGGKIDPQAVRWAVKHLHRLPSLALATAGQKDPRGLGANSNGVAVIREVAWAVEVGFERFRGIDPADKRTWDLVAVGVPSSASLSGRRRHAGSAAFNEFPQPWMRDLTWEWARAMRPTSSVLRLRLRGCLIAAQALTARPGGGTDPAALQFADMTAVAQAFRQLRNADGTAMSSKTRQDLQAAFYTVLDFGRAAGLLDRLSGSFARHSSHRIVADEPNEDEVGKAVPESVIRQLDANLDLLGRDFVYGQLRPHDITAMFQTTYVLLRDTGRRPWEICNLHLDCVESQDGDYSLIWNNRKGRRNRRRLPITAATAHAVLTWREHRLALAVPPRSKNHLPAITNDSGDDHLRPGNLSRAIRAWADAIPALDSEILGPDGTRLPLDRMLIYPYAFRHSYAQRHADAGVDLDVLRELMDHKSVETTLGYYTVSLKRKREAVKTVRLRVVDRHGRAAPMASNTAYEARSVAVPFGNCIEPSNVKAGGKGCPIRFQCAGCGFYRPDPSYLPAVEDHVRSLKADRETALAMDAADFVVRNLEDQVTAFGDVAERMRHSMQELTPEERTEVEQASSVLRKTRAAAAGRAVLLLTVLPAAPRQRDAADPPTAPAGR
ncbi:hypothetical protein DMB66_18410 [Actinoplanes sp. ATCC 53533]|uniref:site-specific integrase n=1 Tax=Actinoplanes sp. ATCC 53533 TaxID=1288362 RepID=UPI000F79AD46|nr:site-specific integrase [Actinoplanes sp. ATCC 53533]RSM64889.1 hypothetical protein DMB66_18410 [Actinoplanes sp. ATCC 53533]